MFVSQSRQICNTLNPMKSITIRLPEPLVGDIEAESRGRKISSPTLFVNGCSSLLASEAPAMTRNVLVDVGLWWPCSVAAMLTIDGP